MLSNCCKLTDVGRRIWLHVSSGPMVQQQWHSPSSWNTKRYFWKDEYTILKSDWINNMDHMRISGTESSSVVLNQTKYSKTLNCDAWIMSKLEWGCPIGTKYPRGNQFLTARFYLTARASTDRRTDRQTDRVIPVYPPPLTSLRGYNKLKPQRDGIINPQNYNFNRF